MNKTAIIYLDHAAATPLDSDVLAAMQPYFSDRFFNPSSPYAPALEVRHEYDAAKDMLARSIGAQRDEIIMTAGATESINLAFSSINGHIVTSAIEHQAVLESARRHNHTFLDSTPEGVVTAEAVSGAIRPDTQLVSIALANNELGTIQHLSDISAVVGKERDRRQADGKQTPLYFHTDASQGAGLLDIHVSRLGVDLLTLNAGKVYGPKQVGLLWVKTGVEVVPVIAGGGQERGIRSGTENVAGVIGFAKALQLATTHRKQETDRLTRLRDLLENRLLAAFPEAVVSGAKKRRLSSHLHIAFPGLDAERLVFRLETRGVLVATGSACAANKGTRSHVLEAIGLPPETADGSLRLSLGRLSTEENTVQAADILIEEIAGEYGRIGTL